MKIETSHNEQDQGKGSSSSSNAGRIFRVDLHPFRRIERDLVGDAVTEFSDSRCLMGSDGLGVFKGVDVPEVCRDHCGLDVVVEEKAPTTWIRAQDLPPRTGTAIGSAVCP